MTVNLILDDNEDKITPMKIAEALIDSGQVTYLELKELVAYLSIFLDYNHKV